MDLYAVATISGDKWHYGTGDFKTLCGREVVGSTGKADNGCKRCLAKAEKLNAYNDRTAYAAKVAETQDDIMNQATEDVAAFREYLRTL